MRISDWSADVCSSDLRNRGTIGGSVANNDPAADYPAACLGLGATINTNSRELKADDFFTGLFETALADDEIIVSVSFPKPAKAAYMKFRSEARRGGKASVSTCRYRWSPTN